jgi:hypothetical protein
MSEPLNMRILSLSLGIEASTMQTRETHVGCVLYSRSIETGLGLIQLNVFLIGPLIGRTHTNLFWRPRSHDTIYKGLRGHRKS